MAPAGVGAFGAAEIVMVVVVVSAPAGRLMEIPPGAETVPPAGPTACETYTPPSGAVVGDEQAASRRMLPTNAERDWSIGRPFIFVTGSAVLRALWPE
jgi:hypothetical protein